MKNWNVEAFKTAVNNFKIHCLRNKESIEDTGYELWKTMDIYLYIADVVLKGAVSGATVSGWTKETSAGPKYPEYMQMMEAFFGTKLTTIEVKGKKEMKANYTDFTRERVYEVHCAVCSYLDERGDEMAFWNMCDIIDNSKVALPKTVYEAVQGFVDQYLEGDLFGAIYSQKERVDFDLKDMELVEVDCPNAKEGDDHFKWFKLKNMYDNIADTYIRPVLVEE